jgi:hypothetical protein
MYGGKNVTPCVVSLEYQSVHGSISSSNVPGIWTMECKAAFPLCSPWKYNASDLAKEQKSNAVINNKGRPPYIQERK